MPEITRALLRKRAEHNEGIISTLEELTLHQEELESINEVLGATCRKLKILYLQNNLISKIQNLNHLKELEYINLALNNVAKIEGLQNCEHIKKIDLTANFIDLDELEASMDHLQSRDRLAELFMMGNPSQANWPSFNAYVIGRLPQLKSLDGTEITKSMQISARQNLDKNTAELRRLAVEVRAVKLERKKRLEEEKALQKLAEVRVEEESEPLSEMEAIERENQKIALEREKMTENTPEARLEIYREIAQQKKEKEDAENANKPKERNYAQEHEESKSSIREAESSVEEGEIRQKNESGYNFHWDEESNRDYLELKVDLPKHLDSSLVDVDVHPTYISIIIKSKLLRLRLPVEVKAGESSCKRSKTTGELVIKMPKVNTKETTIFVSTEKQKASRAASNSLPKGKQENIKMPTLNPDTNTADLLVPTSTTVFSADNRTVRKPKKLSMQEEMMLAANNS